MKDEETPSLPRGQLPSCKRLWRLKVTCVPRTQYHTLQNDVSLEDDPPHIYIYISRDTKSQKEIMRKGLVKSGSSGNKFWSKSDLGSDLSSATSSPHKEFHISAELVLVRV